MLVLAQILLGAVVGYITVSLAESFLHRNIQHASKTVRALWTIPLLGPVLKRSWYDHHVIHHHATFRSSYIRQFSSCDQRLALERKLTQLNYGSTIDRKFGMSLGGVSNIARFVLPVIPAVAAEMLLLGVWAWPGIVVAAVVYPMMSKYFHSYMHATCAEATRAPWHIRWLVTSSYGRAVRLHHWMHHQYETCNYNLIIGGDWLLGVHRGASPDDVLRCKDLDLI